MSEWNNTPIANKLRAIKKSLKKLTSFEEKRQQIIITKLHIAHICLTHKHLLETNDSDINEISVKHMLIDCIKFNRERQFANIPYSLKDMLATYENK